MSENKYTVTILYIGGRERELEVNEKELESIEEAYKRRVVSKVYVEDMVGRSLCIHINFKNVCEISVSRRIALQ